MEYVELILPRPILCVKCDFCTQSQICSLKLCALQKTLYALYNGCWPNTLRVLAHIYKKKKCIYNRIAYRDI